MQEKQRHIEEQGDALGLVEGDGAVDGRARGEIRDRVFLVVHRDGTALVVSEFVELRKKGTRGKEEEKFREEREK